jgi:NAD(P)-dependent dehydrogenase (short-subunit alcohol dehydrogenase family)
MPHDLSPGTDGSNPSPSSRESRTNRIALHNGGSIVIMSSVAGLRGSAGLAGYCATKGGVRLFAKAVGMECAAADDGIRINTVHPGVIDTPIWTKLPTSTGSNTPIDPNEVARAAVPLGRAGQAQDIANGVLFLASDASNYMTGAELVIDGGMDGRRQTSLELRLPTWGSSLSVRDVRVLLNLL